MPPLPTGTVTFLFTDIAGSTALWERDREAMQAALALHDRLLRTAIESRNGHVFKTVGDAFCAAFARAQDAVEATVDAQRALSAADWSMLGEAAPLQSRMGLHTGEADERGGDYFGPPVNRVARLEAAGHGGQVLLSDATYNLVRDRLPDGCSLRDWGEHRLKDLRHTEHIFQLEGPGLPDVATPPTTAEALHPRDRVRVVEADAVAATDSPSREAGGGLWARLESALRSESGDAITLTTVEAAELARHKPADWREWRLGRVAEWSQPRYRLDGRFVGLTLLVDQGEESTSGRWAAKEERYDDLGALLAATSDPAIVVLGPPGGGKSTLLRRLELDTAIAGLRGEAEGGGDRITFFISLNTYAAPEPGAPLPAPGKWLSAQWSARNPALPPLDDLLAEGRVTLLVDALNEMPSASDRDFRERVQLWKAWLQQLVAAHAGNRVVFSCRSLDYSQPLSTPDLRVPQVRIEPLADDQVRNFLALYSPDRWREIWAALDGSPQLEVLRSPYFLALIVEQVAATGEMPAGRAALFTGFVRQALRREIERGNPLFEPGKLIDSRDVRRIAAWKWPTPYDLPDRGLLVPKLAALAHAMQSARDDGGGSQVRIDYDDALDVLACDADAAIVQAGEALAVLDEDQAAQELMYVHQLLQEYFAARQLAREPNPELVRREWRAEAISPTVEEVLDNLDPADELPPLPSTGWEETTLLAAAMTDEPEAFVRGLMDANLSLAGRAALQPEVRSQLGDRLLDELRWALVRRSRDPGVDLRERIDCGYAVGDLGDPRFECRAGPYGAYLWPPIVEMPGGAYPIGDDEPIIDFSGSAVRRHIPRHQVVLQPYLIGQFPVTNAEWSAFMAGGGYDDDRWWDTATSRSWRRGVGTAAGAIADVRYKWTLYGSQPELLDRLYHIGAIADAIYERWLLRLHMTSDELTAHLADLYPGGPLREPRHWREPRFNHPSQPVVGICWHEARAYCAWLSDQSGAHVRLPAEVEWEASARGVAGRAYPWGKAFSPRCANTVTSHIGQPTPVGAFPDGDTPTGVSDLGGNVFVWTSTAWGMDFSDAQYCYPYDPSDGRELADTDADLLRIVRGGAFSHHTIASQPILREAFHPAERDTPLGFRLAFSA